MECKACLVESHGQGKGASRRCAMKCTSHCKMRSFNEPELHENVVSTSHHEVTLSGERLDLLKCCTANAL